jgi:hypothetical protein
MKMARKATTMVIAPSMMKSQRLEARVSKK